MLKNELGVKYQEYKPRVDDIKNKLKHANKLMLASKNLPIAFLKENKYDIYQQTHEPFNVFPGPLLQP